jgi:nucleotide-binding universal stress UspA family protein
MFKTILFPIDQSRETREAVDIVSNIVKKYESHLILLSVVETTPKEENSTEVGIMGDEKAVESLLNQAKDLFTEKGITVEILEQEGKPPFTICDIADDKKVDLIIMGSRGLELMDEDINQSVTHRVINLSPCPVLVVP